MEFVYTSFAIEPPLAERPVGIIFGLVGAFPGVPGGAVVVSCGPTGAGAACAQLSTCSVNATRAIANTIRYQFFAVFIVLFEPSILTQFETIATEIHDSVRLAARSPRLAA